MSFLRNLKEEKVEVELKADKRNVIIGGREYEIPHLIAIGLKELVLEMKEGNVMIKGKFDELPLIEKSSPDVIKAKISGEDLPGELYETPQFKERVLKLDRMFLRFEEDENGVILRLRGNDFIRLKGLRINSSVYTSINIILIPYAVGALWFKGPMVVRLNETKELFEIEVRPR
jgi:hypothetical protein